MRELFNSVFEYLLSQCNNKDTASRVGNNVKPRICTQHRGGSRWVQRVLEHPSNIHMFTAKYDNCTEAVLENNQTFIANNDNHSEAVLKQSLTRDRSKIYFLPGQ